MIIELITKLIKLALIASCLLECISATELVFQQHSSRSHRSHNKAALAAAAAASHSSHQPPRPLLSSLLSTQTTVQYNLSSTTLCIDPSQSELEKLLQHYQTMHRLNHTEFVKNYSLVVMEDWHQTTRQLKLVDNTLCNRRYENLTRLSQRTLCPWTPVTNYNASRYPSETIQAKCRCSECTTTVGQKMFKLNNRLSARTNRDEYFYNCQPVYKHTVFLRRVIKNGDMMSCNDNSSNSQRGVYEWRPVLEPISVACVCGLSRDWLSGF